ncbi:helix-turn-helix transcriptional regulator [Allobaculum stercoricanis]|uniref:helix-turn-helix domain-containing protein n=1 Tax=Allobaculum stercoricanis TaxID=174709 RepID=UPI002941E8A0|nr:helix-turn-helix transcriptional regulator [Allobaculum stercoricanis]
MTDTKRFKAMMALKGYTLECLAKELGLSIATLSYKINNIRQFKVNEIKAIQIIWNLTPEERDAIFFADEVDK